MPEYRYWESLFDVDKILTAMDLKRPCGLVVEFGSGYGTFAIPLAQTAEQYVGFDIDSAMVKFLQRRADDAGLSNIQIRERDVLETGTGLKNEADFVLLFNLLHHEFPLELIQEAWKTLKPGGVAALMHWRKDIETPRGPDPSIRPDIHDFQRWVLSTGFEVQEPLFRDLPPWHFGLLARKI